MVLKRIVDISMINKGGTAEYFGPLWGWKTWRFLFYAIACLGSEETNNNTQKRRITMKLRNLVGDRFKERPSDCVIDSHAFSVRGGYIKYVANGIFSLYPPMKRITKKI